MSGGRTRQTQTTRGTENQTQTTTGTPFAQDLLGQIGGQNVIGDVFAANDGGYQGDRTAPITVPTNVGGQWGPTPQTFVSQRTTAGAPTATNRTDVNINDQAGIDAGIVNANAQQGALGDLSTQGIGAVQSQIGSPNQGLDAMLQRLRSEHALTSGQQVQDLAGVAGADGSFGGTTFARDNAMQAGRLQSAFDNQAAQLLWDDQARQDQWLRDAPGLAGQYAGLGDLTAQRLLNYGGLNLQNEQNTADVEQQNQDAANFNAWQQGTLTDQNTERATQDAIAQWEAGFQTSDQNARNDLTRAGLQQTVDQAGLDNNYGRWAGGQESINELINRLQTLMGIGAQAPGGTQFGAMNQTTNSTTSQSSSPLSTLGSLLGAGMQFSQLGGFGSLAGAGAGAAGVGGAAAGAAGGLSSLLPLILASERKLKTDIEPLFKDKRDVQWYTFKYKDDPTKAVQTGVMVEELERFAPHVVHMINGVKHVNYTALSEWG